VPCTSCTDVELKVFPIPRLVNYLYSITIRASVWIEIVEKFVKLSFMKVGNGFNPCDKFREVD